MGDKQKPVPDSDDKTKTHPQGDPTSHAKLLGESGITGPSTKLTFEHSDEGSLTRVLTNDRTYYEIGPGTFAKYMKGAREISQGTFTVDEKKKEFTYCDDDNMTRTTLRADGSSVVKKHIYGVPNDKCPVLEIHNPPKADGTAGDVRKFTYDDHGNRVGYSVISANKNLCSNWKKVDDTHWRKVDEKGNFIKDQDQKKDEKNVLFGHLHVSSEGTVAFENKRQSTEEAKHWTVIAADGTRHERITKLDKPMVADASHPLKGEEAKAAKEALKAADTMHALQADIVRAHFDEIKSSNPALGLFVGAVDAVLGKNPMGGAIGRQEVDAVLKDASRTPEQKMTAAILKKCMDIHGTDIILRHELDSKAFEDTLAKISLDDIAYDQVNKKT